MKTTFFSTFLLFLLQQLSAQEIPIYSRAETDTILNGDYNIRALLIEGSTIYYGADKSRIGYINVASKERKEFKYEIDDLEFRSIAKTKDHIFALNAGSPAVLTRMEKNGSNLRVVYDDYNPKVFYDSMQFWNNYEGIALGDPLNGCMAVVITRNGGKSWNRLPCFLLPPVIEGEAAFAASNTNIVIKGDRTWLVTGGMASRVLYSPDKGKNWYISETPMVSGKPTTGIYSADFYDFKYGFLVGGDYLDPQMNNNTKAITSDGGKTWKSISNNEGFGYASCVQYIPGSDGKALVTVGPAGLQYSSDYGSTWTQLLADDSLYTIRFQNSRTAYAAGKNKIIRISFKE